MVQCVCCRMPACVDMWAMSPAINQPSTANRRVIEEMGENIEERINLQKGLFEIEDANVYNKHEMRQLDEFLESGGSGAPACVIWPWAAMS